MLSKTKQTKYITEGAIKELIETILRSALHDQARQLETHLRDIDRRLKDLESGR